jgi:hypothetical protein
MSTEFVRVEGFVLDNFDQRDRRSLLDSKVRNKMVARRHLKVFMRIHDSKFVMSVELY